MRSSLFLLLLLACAACDSASPGPGEMIVEGVTFGVNQTEVQSGDRLELVIRNGSDRVLSMGSLGCATVERQNGSDWEVLESDNLRACTFSIFVVDPGQAQAESLLLDVSPGTVRLLHTFGLEGTGHEIYSPTIRVLP